MDAVFDSLYTLLQEGDLVQVSACIESLAAHVDPVGPCGHHHGRRLQIHRVYELVRPSAVLC